MRVMDFSMQCFLADVGNHRLRFAFLPEVGQVSVDALTATALSLNNLRRVSCSITSSVIYTNRTGWNEHT
jgi:hypothetical protein